MNNIIHLVNVSQIPLLKAKATLMTQIFTISRLKYKPDFLNFTSVCPLPLIPASFSKSFEEVALSRAAEIWQNLQNKQSVNVQWSGGIDSTTALVALILSRPSDSLINVYCNLNSIIENPEFYKKLLGLSFITLKNSSFIPSDTSLEIVTGELGDQIFGSDHILSLGNIFGFENNFKDYKVMIPKFFAAKAGEKFGHFIYERYLPIVDEAPFKIDTAYDFLWWWNISQKWQSTKFHQQGLVGSGVKFIHFFEDQDFQLWSFFNHEKKIDQTIATYKMPAKKFIYSFDQNLTYLTIKRKYPSPIGNKRHFYGLGLDGSQIKTFSEVSDLIQKMFTISI